jgi:uncharacterized damage-inducible protein DinB
MDTERRRPDPLLDEKAALLAFLDEQRKAMLRKLDGEVSLEDLTRPAVPSGTSLLGLVKHLVDVERGWFRIVLEGEDDVPLSATKDDPDADFRVEPGETAEAITAWYVAEIGRSNDLAGRMDLDQRSARRDVTLRWVLLHMIEETARHAGHADIIREQLDGATGL